MNIYEIILFVSVVICLLAGVYSMRLLLKSMNKLILLHEASAPKTTSPMMNRNIPAVTNKIIHLTDEHEYETEQGFKGGSNG